jgi:uncharacterized protein YgbK (DUF1537 family)
MTASALEAALAAAPPSAVVDPAIVRVVAEAGATVIVLDDDPTGTQTVTELPIITRWDQADLRWAFAQNAVGFCVLTNSRSLSTDAARDRTRSVIEAVHAAADGRPYVLISRGDSTLRGHHVDEIDEATATLARVGWGEVDAVLIVPAFPDAGRITVDAVHWVFDHDEWLGAGESSFARDATFGYRASDLREFTEERSRGTRPAGQVEHIGLDQVRGDPEALRARIESVEGGRHVVVDAVDENDLRRISLAALRAEKGGRRLLYRTSPGLLRPRLGQRPLPPLTPESVGVAIARARPATRHGLVVLGSHVPLSTRQLDHLLRTNPDVRHLVIDVPELVRGGATAAVLAEVVARTVAALADSDVVLSTSRERMDGVDGDDSLRIARLVSEALVHTTREVLRLAEPSFLIGKGGITSSDLATGAVGLRRATILGSLLPGMVSVWQSGDPGLADVSATPYAVFPGNVGGDEALSQALTAFRAGVNSTG